MKRIVVLGAGLTGISTVYHLEELGIEEISIFEKESEPGGLCRSIQKNGFTFDYTGHLLHLSDPYAHTLIAKHIGFDSFNTIQRRSFIYSHNIYTPYPFQINLRGLPTSVIAECVEGFITRPQINDPTSFTDWVYTSFGAGFAKHFFLSYQEKIFAYDVQKITASWTGRFVPQTSLHEIIDGISGNSLKDIGYNATFFYPKKGGISSWVSTFAKTITTPIHLSMTVTRIDSKKKIIYFANGHTQSYDILISTLPLDTMLSLLIEPTNSYLSDAHVHLQCNSVVNFNLGINRDNISDKHWIYFPEKKIPFYRLGFPHNFSLSMAPYGCSSVYGEFSHVNKSAPWIEETLKESIATTQKLLGISKQEIIAQEIIHIPHGYVIFDEWRDTHLPTLLMRLQEMNIYSIGRYGEWKYASMQEALLDGKKTAHTIAHQLGFPLYSAQQPHLNTNG